MKFKKRRNASWLVFNPNSAQVCPDCKCEYTPTSRRQIYCVSCGIARNGMETAKRLREALDRCNREARKRLAERVVYYDPKEYEKGNLVRINP